MSEQELEHARLIDELMSQRLKPIYWIFGIFMTAFMTISVPLTATLIETVKVQQLKLSKADAERIFVSKFTYYQIEEDEHRMLLPLLKDPNAKYIMDEINDNIAQMLDMKYYPRSSR